MHAAARRELPRAAMIRVPQNAVALERGRCAHATHECQRIEQFAGPSSCGAPTASTLCIGHHAITRATSQGIEAKGSPQEGGPIQTRNEKSRSVLDVSSMS